MTHRASARLAGFTFLFYITIGLTEMVLSGKARVGAGTAEKLASVAQHAPLMRVCALLVLLECVSALVLGVSLYALTRDTDHDVAVLALSFRLGEGFINAVAAATVLALVWVATRAVGAAAPDAAATNALGAFVLKAGSWFYFVGAWLFTVGSTLYSYLFLRARSIPVSLAWLGIIGSSLVVIALPAQMLELIASPVTDIVWIPIFAFEVVLGLWLIIKGVSTPTTR